jgi:catechol 2,3-dioxygenase-like lactoylglutathione lyase family enzyme
MTRAKAADIDHLDHTVLLTRDLDAAADRYQALGFTVSPRSAHLVSDRPDGELVPTGTANRCVYFGESFIELLGLPPENAATGIPSSLEAYHGIHLTLGCGDVESVAGRLRTGRWSSTPVWRLQREVDTPDGQRTVQARSVRVDLARTPEGGLQVAQHLTPEYVHQPRYLDHANGARRLDSVLIIAPDPEVNDYVARYEQILTVQARTAGPKRVLSLRAGVVVIIPESAVDEVLPGYVPPAVPLIAAHAVAVTDLVAARRLVDENGIPTQSCPDGFFVAADHACGAPLVFVSP